MVKTGRLRKTREVTDLIVPEPINNISLRDLINISDTNKEGYVSITNFTVLYSGGKARCYKEGDFVNCEQGMEISTYLGREMNRRGVV